MNDLSILKTNMNFSFDYTFVGAVKPKNAILAGNPALAAFVDKKEPPAYGEYLQAKMLAFSTESTVEQYEYLHTTMDDEIDELFRTKPELFSKQTLYRAGSCMDRLSWTGSTMSAIKFAREVVGTEDNLIVKFGTRALHRAVDVYALDAESKYIGENEAYIPRSERLRAMADGRMTTVMTAKQFAMVGMVPCLMSMLARIDKPTKSEAEAALVSIINNGTHTDAEYANFIGVITNNLKEYYNRNPEWAQACFVQAGGEYSLQYQDYDFTIITDNTEMMAVDYHTYGDLSELETQVADMGIPPACIEGYLDAMFSMQDEDVDYRDVWKHMFQMYRCGFDLAEQLTTGAGLQEEADKTGITIEQYRSYFDCYLLEA